MCEKCFLHGIKCPDCIANDFPIGTVLAAMLIGGIFAVIKGKMRL